MWPLLLSVVISKPSSPVAVLSFIRLTGFPCQYVASSLVAILAVFDLSLVVISHRSLLRWLLSQRREPSSAYATHVIAAISRAVKNVFFMIPVFALYFRYALF